MKASFVKGFNKPSYLARVNAPSALCNMHLGEDALVVVCSESRGNICKK